MHTYMDTHLTIMEQKILFYYIEKQGIEPETRGKRYGVKVKLIGQDQRADRREREEPARA